MVSIVLKNKDGKNLNDELAFAISTAIGNIGEAHLSQKYKPSFVSLSKSDVQNPINRNVRALDNTSKEKIRKQGLSPEDGRVELEGGDLYWVHEPAPSTKGKVKTTSFEVSLHVGTKLSDSEFASYYRTPLKVQVRQTFGMPVELEEITRETLSRIFSGAGLELETVVPKDNWEAVRDAKNPEVSREKYRFSPDSAVIAYQNGGPVLIPAEMQEGHSSEMVYIRREIGRSNPIDQLAKVVESAKSKASEMATDFPNHYFSLEETGRGRAH